MMTLARFPSPAVYPGYLFLINPFRHMPVLSCGEHDHLHRIIVLDLLHRSPYTGVPVFVFSVYYTAFFFLFQSLFINQYISFCRAPVCHFSFFILSPYTIIALFIRYMTNKAIIYCKIQNQQASRKSPDMHTSIHGVLYMEIILVYCPANTMPHILSMGSDIHQIPAAALPPGSETPLPSPRKDKGPSL